MGEDVNMPGDTNLVIQCMFLSNYIYYVIFASFRSTAYLQVMGLTICTNLLRIHTFLPSYTQLQVLTTLTTLLSRFTSRSLDCRSQLSSSTEVRRAIRIPVNFLCHGITITITSTSAIRGSMIHVPDLRTIGTREEPITTRLAATRTT